MKLVPLTFSELNFREKYSHMDLIDELESKLKTTYGAHYLNGNFLETIFGITDPRGKTVLDLGCGSRNSEDSSSDPLRFEPWLLRALHEYGVNCIGVDSGGLEGEKFEGYNWELCWDGSLDQLKDNSVDIACAFNFFDSPALFGTGRRTFKTLLPQLERVVKLEGCFIFETTCSGYEPKR